MKINIDDDDLELEKDAADAIKSIILNVSKIREIGIKRFKALFPELADQVDNAIMQEDNGDGEFYHEDLKIVRADQLDYVEEETTLLGARLRFFFEGISPKTLHKLNIMGHAKVHSVQPEGGINVIYEIRIAVGNLNEIRKNKLPSKRYVLIFMKE